MNADKDAGGADNSSDRPSPAGSLGEPSSARTERPSFQASHGNRSDGPSATFRTEEQSTCRDSADPYNAEREHLDEAQQLFDDVCKFLDGRAEHTHTTKSRFEELKRLQERGKAGLAGQDVHALLARPEFADRSLDGLLSHRSHWANTLEDLQRSMQNISRKPTLPSTSAAGAASSRQDVRDGQMDLSQAESLEGLTNLFRAKAAPRQKDKRGSHTARPDEPMSSQPGQSSHLPDGQVPASGGPFRTTVESEGASDSRGTQMEQPGHSDTGEATLETSESSQAANVSQAGPFKGFKKGFLC